MRALFALILLFLLAAIGWVGLTRSERIVCRMKLNKAIHEYSIHKEEAAIERAVALLKNKPDYQPALETTIGWMTERKKFARALTLASNPQSLANLPPRARYQLAVCAYETGNEQQATRLLRQLAGESVEDEDVPVPLVTAYLKMQQGDCETARTVLEAANSHFDGDLFYHSLFGRTAFVCGDVSEATRELSRAVALGEQNPRARLLLAVCRALRGDLAGMERWLDALEAKGLDAYAEAQTEIDAWLERLRADIRYVSESEQMDQRERAVNLRLALAAIDVRRGEMARANERIDALARDYPDRVGLATRKGLLLERQRLLNRALPHYRKEAGQLFLAAYKIATIAPSATTATEAAMWRDFLSTRALVLDATAMKPTAGVAGHRGWNLFAAGDFTTTFAIDSTGRHAFDLIARGETAAGIWPIVLVSVDEELVGELYINSPVWNLFAWHQRLLEGTHTVRISYVNNAVEPDVKGDRNFHLDKMIVRPAPD